MINEIIGRKICVVYRKLGVVMDDEGKTKEQPVDLRDSQEGAAFILALEGGLLAGA